MTISNARFDRIVKKSKALIKIDFILQIDYIFWQYICDFWALK
jgi:hypothetical protein